jgi:hypothetical protein
VIAMIEENDYKKILKELKKTRIVTNFYVPYFGGYSLNGRRIYVSKNVPNSIKINGKKLDLRFAIAFHELCEKQSLNRGLTYAGAHREAIQYEKKYVHSKGIKWADYDKVVGKLMHQNFYRSKREDIPLDLDLTPYEYSKETETLKWMKGLIKKKRKKA